MLVTCPECSHKISSESEECKKCGFLYSGRRSREYCEKVVKVFSWLFIWPAFMIREHLESWRHGWLNLDYNGDADEYIKIVRVFVCDYAHGSGYQVELVLECRCGQKFASHVNPQEGLLVEGCFRGRLMCDVCTRKI